VTDSWSEDQRRHFNKRLPEYVNMYGVDSSFHNAMAGSFLDLARPRQGESVLDIGCGMGRASVPLLQAGCYVTGLDISGPSLDALIRRVDKLGLTEKFDAVCRGAEEIEYTKRFQLVTGRGILHHLNDPVAVIRKIRRALLPGGRAVFMDPNPLNLAWIPYILFHPTLAWSIERRVLRQTPSRTIAMLETAGLKRIRHTYAGLVPPPLWGRVSRAADIERRLVAVPVLRKLALYLLVSGER